MAEGQRTAFQINATGNDRPALKDLYDHVVMEVAERWKDLGVQLLRSDQEGILNIIEANHPHDVVSCCKHVFKKWLDTSEDTTWNMLMKALRRPSVQLNYLAGQLKKMLIIEYLQPTTRRRKGSSMLMGSIAKKRKVKFKKPTVKKRKPKTQKRKVKSYMKLIYPLDVTQPTTKKRKLKNGIQRTVKKRKVEDCITAKENIASCYAQLARLPITPMLVKLQGKGVITVEEKEQIKAKPEEGEESERMEYFLDYVIVPSLVDNVIIKFKRFLEVMEESGDPKLLSIAVKLGLVVTEPPPPDKGTRAACKKLKNILHVETQFAKMTNKIKQALISNSVDVASLIEQLCTISTVKNRRVPLFDKDVFEKIKSIDELWKVLRSFWSIFDYELLQCVVEISECKKAQDILEEFLLRIDPSAIKDVDLVLHCRVEDQEGSLKPVLRIKVNRKKCTLNVKKSVEEIVSKIYDLDGYALLFKGIKEGCIELLYYISKPLKLHLLQLKISERVLKEFLAHKIISLHIDETKVIDNTDKAFTWSAYPGQNITGSKPVDVQSHSDYIKGYYKHTRYVTEQEEWPPNQLKQFTSLAIIHYKSGYTEREVIASRKATQHTNIMSSSPSFSHITSLGQSLDKIKASKDISEIFAPSKDGHKPHHVLIEGAPGIGKTTLSKHIALQWADGGILESTKLLYLIVLRDPLAQKITSLKDLVKYYHQHEENSEVIASSCANYMLSSGGERVVFVLDGYDEYPKHLRQNGFISDLLQHKILPSCQVIVTSRPHASAHLRGSCDQYIEILGFTKEDRKKYIEDSLKNKKDVDTLVEYLDSHLIISSLCFIPFNMTVLLWLYKQGITLPDTFTELYNYFICHTIRHHLGNNKIFLPDSFVDLNTLEDPYRQIVEELAFLSYQALNTNQVTFTLDEIKTKCPQIDKITGGLNSFGLLQAMEHFDNKENTLILNFVHFSVQEFLAAYHITCLPHYEEFCALKENFMSDFYVNTFTMYVGMTKGQRPAFKQYLNGSGDWTAYMYGLLEEFSPLNLFGPTCMISHELVNERTCFRLFKCFQEAGDEVLCSAIGNRFIKTISMHYELRFSDVECLGIFLGNRKACKRLYFDDSIGDVGFQILHRLLTNRNTSTSIHSIYIGCTRYGSLTPSRDKILTQLSSCLIIGIAECCKTKILEVFLPVLLLKDVVSLKNQFTKLTLYVEDNYAAVTTFIPELVCGSNTLKVLKLYYNESCELPMEGLKIVLRKNNKVLSEKSFTHNPQHRVLDDVRHIKKGEIEVYFIPFDLSLSPPRHSVLSSISVYRLKIAIYYP